MKRKYIPDLTKQMAICEANYARIYKLMPRLEEQDQREFNVAFGEQLFNMKIEVVERFSYTSTIQISQQSHHDLSWLEAPSLIVRLYHDAGMAEVICMKRRRQLSGAYPYPNREMHQPDEKVQLNHYLSEWLGHCLTHGHLVEPVFAV
jgi:hypothetical protein